MHWGVDRQKRRKGRDNASARSVNKLANSTPRSLIHRTWIWNREWAHSEMEHAHDPSASWKLFSPCPKKQYHVVKKDSSLTTAISHLCPYFSSFKRTQRDFPGGPMFKTPHIHCRMPRFNPWLGTKIPHVSGPKRWWWPRDMHDFLGV